MRRAYAEDSRALDSEARQQIAAAIREARERAGLTLEVLGKRVGFGGYKPMWLIEHARMPIPPESIGPLEEVLGLAPRSLFWAECRCRLLRMGFDLDAALDATDTPSELPYTGPERRSGLDRRGRSPQAEGVAPVQLEAPSSGAPRDPVADQQMAD